ncbi:EamA family transporter [Streptomyces sp. HUAS MG47]|uniref:EamA family transporter n=1 Tax=Streptomyces solicamelliae TaxID=3231716 RepID=UPI0038779106
MVPLFAFSLLSALVDVFAGARLQQVDPGAVAAVAFTLTGVVFCTAAVVRMRWKPLVAVARAHARDLLVVNVTTALSWLSLLYALKLMEPAVANVVSIAIGPAFTVVMQMLWWRRDKVLPGEFVSAVGILATLVLLVWASLTGESGVGARDLTAMSLGVFAAVVSGAATSANVVFSARLGAAGVDVPTVMGLRFGLVAVGGWVMAGFAGFQALGEAVVPGVVVAVIGVSVPAYLVQVGVRRVPPMTASMVISLAPVLTLLLQLFDTRLEFSTISAVGIAVITLFIGVGLLARRSAQRPAPPPTAENEDIVHAVRDH